MNWLSKLGGRKWMLALIAIAVSTAIEIYTVRGLSPTFATLLGSLVAAFSMSNFACTRDHNLSSKKKEVSGNQYKLDASIKKDIDILKQTTEAAAQVVVNTHKLVAAAITNPGGKQ